jgi:hypothetical protein
MKLIHPSFRIASAALGLTSAALAQLAPPAPLAVPTLGLGSGCPGQELYINTLVGELFRIDDYATNPTAVQVGGPLFVWDLAFHPATGLMYSVGLATCQPGSRFYTFDAGFNPTLVGETCAFSGGGLEFGGDGSLWTMGTSTTSKTLWSVDPATGNPTAVVDMPERLAGDLAVDRAGRVLSANLAGEIDVYDPASGSVSTLGPHGIVDWVAGLDMDLDGTLYAVTETGEIHAIDTATMTTHLVGDLQLDGHWVAGAAFVLPADTQGAVGTSYCASDPNSTGGAAQVAALGSASLAVDHFVLRAAPVPDQPFLFVLGASQQQVPFGNGWLCVGGAPTPLHPTGLASGGLALRCVDLAAAGITLPGTYDFQCWFRDPAAGGAGFDASDGLEVTFVP